MRQFYAAQRPRGFANETIVRRFYNARLRDAWVADHESDGDVNAASHGAVAITASRARYLIKPTEWRDELPCGGVYSSR